ncbi:MAG: hypothetical protein WC749_05915 [Dehalococcoidia bacterium]
MLTKYDEMLCHQINPGFDEVGTTERNWSDHIWAGFFDTANKIHVGYKFGKYPNRNVMDAAGGVAISGKQITVRASRALHPGIDVEKVGPLAYDVPEPLQRIHIFLGQNDYGASFDIEFEASSPPMAEPGGHTSVSGFTINKEVRYYQACRASGKVSFEGKTYHIKKETSYAFRDHTWGVRGYTGVPPAGTWLWRPSQGSPEDGLMPAPKIAGFLGALFVVHAKDYCLYYTHAEGPDAKLLGTSVIAGAGGYIAFPPGDPRPRISLIHSELDFDIFPGSRRVKSLRGILTREDGEKIKISSKFLGSAFSLDAVGYHGFKHWWPGKWMGPMWLDGEKLDLTDETVLREAGMCMDTAMEFNVDGEVCHGSIQAAAAGELPKYGLRASDMPW